MTLITDIVCAAFRIWFVIVDLMGELLCGWYTVAQSFLLYSVRAMSGLPRNESTPQVTLQYQHEITMYTFAESVLQSVQ